MVVGRTRVRQEVTGLTYSEKESEIEPCNFGTLGDIISFTTGNVVTVSKLSLKSILSISKNGLVF